VDIRDCVAGKELFTDNRPRHPRPLDIRGHRVGGGGDSERCLARRRSSSGDSAWFEKLSDINRSALFDSEIERISRRGLDLFRCHFDFDLNHAVKRPISR
jgi:hypothetical protein